MGFLDKLLGNRDERFYQLVLKSLNEPTTGVEHGIKPFEYSEANTYAYTYVNSKYYTIIDDNAVLISYNPRQRLEVNDMNFYEVIIRADHQGLAEFDSCLENL